MDNFLVIEVFDEKWAQIVSKAFQYDFYHTQSYHLLEKEHRPVLLVSLFGDEFVALPLVIRKIANSDLYDCTSVYGYCGPICSMDFEFFPKENLDHYKDQLIAFFSKNNIITVFSRLHPLITGGNVLFDNLGEVKNINKTVAIDLTLSAEQQRSQYRKSNKSELNQLRKKGFTIEEALTDEDVNSFIAIYNETMDRVGATDSYYFNKEYFDFFLKNKCFHSKLLLAKKDSEVAAGAIFTVTGKIMQYHLAGTTEKYIKDTPMKLVLDEARSIGNNIHLDFLHLGGGVGGSDEDSLFRFKSGFSDVRFDFQIWKFISDMTRYKELVELKFPSEIPVKDFFPLYRYDF